MENSESQEMEILALKNIYEEKYFVVDQMDPPRGRFMVNVRIPNEFPVVCNIEKSNKETENTSFTVDYLPPLTLFFEFPDTYPSDSCPAFLLTSTWLTHQQISVLCRKMESAWGEFKDAILFTWFQFLEEETLSTLDFNECLDVTELVSYGARRYLSRALDSNGSDRGFSRSNSNESSSSHDGKNARELCQRVRPCVSGGCGLVDLRAFNDLPDRRMLLQMLRNFNKFKISDVFETTAHLCEVCFVSKLGTEFATFRECNHFFCRECLRSYFEVQITEGNVHCLNCPDGSCESQADGALVQAVVSEKSFERYDMLLLSSSLESMSDIAYCPRKDCQCPVVIDTCGRMGTCSACHFVFCPFCKMVYHGVAPCNFKSEEKARIFEHYTTGDGQIKKDMEKQYGKRVLTNLIEDTLSENWKSSNSKGCPRCSACIEKMDGCNKMTCFRCGVFFCWLCRTVLKSNPYDHFKIQGTDCFNRLFPEGELDEPFEFEVMPGEFLDFY